LNLWTGRLVDKMKQLPQLADVATDQQTGGLAVSLVIDRVTASRLGIAPSTIDSTLYDAYGQRQINTMYTQLNQYHVILETSQRAANPGKLQDLYIQTNASSGTSGPGASSSFASSGSFIGRLECDDHLGGIHAHRPRRCSARLRMPLTPAWAPAARLQPRISPAPPPPPRRAPQCIHSS
jgi:hypothetical protein